MSSVADIELKVSILVIKMSGVRLTELRRAERYLKLLVVVEVSFALGFGSRIESEAAILLLRLLRIVIGWSVLVGAARLVEEVVVVLLLSAGFLRAASSVHRLAVVSASKAVAVAPGLVHSHLAAVQLECP